MALVYAVVRHDWVVWRHS